MRLGRDAVGGYQREIIRVATARLGRALTGAEKRFVTNRSSLVALELILDTVSSMNPAELASYLASESTDKE